MKNKYVWVIDAGHGGLKDGVYTTPPHLGKFKTFEDGFTIYEGVVNRAIAKLLYQRLQLEGIDFVLCYHDVEDWPLRKRVQITHNVYKKNKNIVLLSIHSNAGGGRGNEVFTSIGQNASDSIADVFCQAYQKHFVEWPFRSCRVDGDGDKEANFRVLMSLNDKKKPAPYPAVLVETLFFDVRLQAELLMNEDFQLRVADCFADAILSIATL